MIKNIQDLFIEVMCNDFSISYIEEKVNSFNKIDEKKEYLLGIMKLFEMKLI